MHKALKCMPAQWLDWYNGFVQQTFQRYGFFDCHWKRDLAVNLIIPIKKNVDLWTDAWILGGEGTMARASVADACAHAATTPTPRTPHPTGT